MGDSGENDLDDIFGSDPIVTAPKPGTLTDLFSDDEDEDIPKPTHVVKSSNVDDLFDSDDESDGDAAPAKRKRLSQKKKRKFQDSDEDDSDDDNNFNNKKKKLSSSSEKKIKRKDKKLRQRLKKPSAGDEGAASGAVDQGDDYDSGEEAVRNKDDDAFLSDESDDDNAALVREYDEENQDFRDERPAQKNKSKKAAAAAGATGGAPAKSSGNDPFSQALASLKAKKVEAWTDTEKQAYVDRLQMKMREACKKDDDILTQNTSRGNSAPPQPALNKLQILDSVKHALSMAMLWNTLLDREILVTLGYWIRPRPDNSLPSLPVRTAIYEALLKLPCQPDHLKKTGLIPGTDLVIKPIGQIIFELIKHKQETMENKKLLRTIVDKWSREIFSKGTEVSSQSMAAHHNDAEIQARLAAKYQASQQARLKEDEEAKYRKENYQRARAPLILGHMFTVQPEIDKKALKRAQKAKEGQKDDEAIEVAERGSGEDGGSGGKHQAEGGRAALLRRMEGGRGGGSGSSDSKRAVSVSVARPSYDFH